MYLRTLHILIAMLIANSGQAEFFLQSVYEFPPAYYGPNPQNRLLEGTPGTFYSTTWYGPTNSGGTIYKITSSGELTYLHFFDRTNGWLPWGSLVWGDDGLLYGVTRNALVNQDFGDGLIFRCSTNGNFSVVAQFYGTNGSKPAGPLAKVSDGSFYGVTEWDGKVFRVSTNGTLSIVFNLNGTSPRNGPVTATNGCVYGTTSAGGSNGVGTLYKICDGQLTTLVHFGGVNGSFPDGELTVGHDHNLYGVTAHGGYQGPGYGTIFRLSNDVFTVVASFNPANGYDPSGGVAQGRDGNLYGAMTYGGYLFKVTPDGVLSPLLTFPGIKPQVGLTRASDGNLYGCLTDMELPFNVPPGMIFRLVDPPRITALNISNQNVFLSWTSFTNGVYQIEHKPSLSATTWSPRLPSITSTGNVSSFVDFSNASVGFYRVVLLP